jgi:hypothetical protein
MYGHIDIGDRVVSPCGVIVQVQDGAFVRLRPKKPGTLRCLDRNIKTIELDLLKPGQA